MTHFLGLVSNSVIVAAAIVCVICFPLQAIAVTLILYVAYKIFA